jgi:autotransporter-associated beta strand protein
MTQHAFQQRLPLRWFAAALMELAAAGPTFAAPPADYTIPTFVDEFNAEVLDSAVWEVHPSRPSVEVADGTLRLITNRQGVDWVEGFVSTIDFTQRYGYYESKYRIGGATGLNNAFWLNTPGDLIRDNPVDRIEVDIQETHFPGELTTNLHDWQPTHWSTGAKHQTGLDLSAEFHTYALQWATDNSLTFFFDGSPFRTISSDTVNSALSLISTEVLFSTKVLPGFAGPLGPNLEGSAMEIDYVRVYQQPGWTGVRNGYWGEADNWGPEGVPGVGRAAVLNRPTDSTHLILTEDTAVQSLYFDGVATPALTLSGTHNLLLGATTSATAVGGVSLNAPVTTTQTIQVPIVAQRPLMFQNLATDNNVALRLQGPIDSAIPGEEIAFGGRSPIEVGGAISEQWGDLAKFGPDTLHLAAANGHAGVTRIHAGILRVSADAALGATGAANGTELASGTSLVLTDGVEYRAPESVHIAGTGAPSRLGAVDLEGPAASLAGTLWLDEDATIASGSGGGVLTLRGDISTQNPGRALTITGSGETVITGNIRDTIREVNKQGNGTLRIGASADVHAPALRIVEGIVALERAASLSSTTNVVVDAGAVLDANPLGGTGYAIPQGQTLSINGTLDGNLTVTNGATAWVNSHQAVQGNVLTLAGGVVAGRGQIAGDLVVEPQGTIRPAVSASPPVIASITVPVSRDVSIAFHPTLATDPGYRFMDLDLAGPAPNPNPRVFRSFLEFDLSQQSGVPASIDRATLQLAISSNDSTYGTVGGDAVLELYHIDRDVDLGEVNAWEYSQGQGWDARGGDFNQLLASVVGDPLEVASGDLVELSGPALDAAVSGALEAGLLRLGLKQQDDDDPAAPRNLFRFQNHADARPPRLVLEDWDVGPTLHVAGNYTQHADALLQISIASATDFDRLSVDGTAALDGVIDVRLSEGFEPQHGSQFTVLTAEQIFDRGLEIGAGSDHFRLHVSATNVTLQYLNLPGDFNGDGQADGADLLAWQRGASPDPLSTADLANWGMNFGTNLSGAGPAATSVPEPDGRVVTVWVLLGAYFFRARADSAGRLQDQHLRYPA